ncbi:MAG TPA: hypothetical protein VNA16_03750 [Abditibacteriaceae bacterium]|nr:hypothetical protein [Abditibacteriaceae bacterium]
MLNQLHEFKARIAETDLFSQVKYEDDQRMVEIANSNTEYHAEWDRIHAELNRIEVNQGRDVADTGIEQIFEIVHVKAAIATVNASLQGDIMDDLMLLARAIRVQYVDAWLDKIWAEYQAGKFPRINWKGDSV